MVQFMDKYFYLHTTEGKLPFNVCLISAAQIQCLLLFDNFGQQYNQSYLVLNINLIKKVAPVSSSF